MLTSKQEKFCKEYLKDLNATQAAVRAGYSAGTANQIASQNLAKLGIQKRIEELKNEQEGTSLLAIEFELAELEQTRLEAWEAIREGKKLVTTVTEEDSERGCKKITKTYHNNLNPAYLQKVIDGVRRRSELHGVEAYLKYLDRNIAIERLIADGYVVSAPGDDHE